MRLILYQPEIAANVGATIRSAACFDANISIIEPCGFPFAAKDLRRAAMDYANAAAPITYASWTQFMKSKDHSSRLVLLSTKAPTPLWNFQFRKNDSLILGQESAGVPDEVRDQADCAINIPLAVGARSLNVSVAAAIALAEARRQFHHARTASQKMD